MAKAAFLKNSGIESIVAKHYSNNKEARGKKILELVNDDPDMKGRKISLSTVQTLLAKWHKQEAAHIAAGISINPLDRPWTIGLSMKYNIPAEIVPMLLDIKESEKQYYILTIRKARWIAYLYPSVEKLLTSNPRVEQVLKKLLPHTALFNNSLTTAPMMSKLEQEFKTKHSTSISIAITILVASLYEKQEQINEITTGEISSLISAPDTTSLDDVYFNKYDISVETWVKELQKITGEQAEYVKKGDKYMPISAEAIKQIVGDDLTVEDIKKKFGVTLTTVHLGLIKQWQSLGISYQTNIRQRETREFFAKHPEMVTIIKLLSQKMRENPLIRYRTVY
jgi:hypothetical protein